MADTHQLCFCFDRKTLTVERLREVLTYDPETGQFARRYDRGRARAGKPLAPHNGNGYIRINVDGAMYYAHRLAWLYMTGQWPVRLIDHVNGDRSDNRFVNLREADNVLNGANCKNRRSNTSGFKGVSFDPKRRRWRSYIVYRGQQRSLGTFITREEAAAAYRKAAADLHGAFARIK